MHHTILLTGGAGFIGSNLADKLVSLGNKVIILDNLATGNKNNLPQEATFIEGDVRKKNDVRHVFDTHAIDTVIHIAGQASTISSFMDPQGDIDVNFTGSANVMLEAIAHNVKRFLYASSMTAYGDPEILPIPETHVTKPTSYYGITKYAAERFVFASASRLDLASPIHATAFRMFNVYGPRQSLTNPYQGVLAIFIGNVMRNEPITIYGDGEQARDFVYIDDVVDAWVAAIDTKETYGEVINLGTGVSTPILKLAKTIIKVLGKDPETYPIIFKEERPGDQRTMQADITKASRILGFTPKNTLEEGLTKTISWAQKGHA